MALETAKEVLCDAEILIAYVVRSGINVDQALIDNIVEAKAKILNDTLTAAEESTFYQVVNTLAAKLAPVSAETLRACSDEFGVTKKSFWRREPVKCSHAKIAVRKQRLWAFVAFALLLVAQIYWLMGSNLISRIPSLAENEVTPSAPSPVGPSPSAEAAQKAAEDEVAAEETRMWLLHLWRTPWKWIPEALKRRVPKEEREQFKSLSDFREWGYSAREVLAILQVYLLPLLYGWVGAMAYVLRRMIKAVQELTFQRAYEVEFSLRIYLGILAGVAIGWFFKPEAPGAGGGEVSFASLTPFALSFVAGYSVELLFTAMDRMVGAFTDRKAGRSVPTPGE